MNNLKRITFILGGVALLVLIAATIIEKVYGSDFVYEHIYGSVSFVVLWAAFAVFSVIYLLKRKVLKNPLTMLLHASFLLILLGALVTWLFGEQGTVHIRESEDTSFFVDKDGRSVDLPFSVKLENFDVVYYAGTRAPMDFVSSIAVSDKKNATVAGIVSMNNIFSYRGYRFYQFGYDEDEGGTFLTVSHDPCGIAITYSGYALLLISLILFFFNPDSRFRKLLKNPLLKRGVMALCLVVNLGQVAAKTHSPNEVPEEKNLRQRDVTAEKPKVLPREVAAGFCDLYVLYNDRICPLQTVAKDFTTKLYGSSTYKGLTPEQVFTGWMFYYSSWKKQPVIKVKSKAVRQTLGTDGKYASFDDFYNEYNEYKLEKIIGKARLGEKIADRKGFEEADEKYNLIKILYSGQLLKIYPHAGRPNDKEEQGQIVGDVSLKKVKLPNHNNAGGNADESLVEAIEWYSQGDRLPDDIGDEEWFFVRKSLDYIHEMVVRKDYDGLFQTFAKLKEYQQKKAGDVLPTDSRFIAEKVYNALTYTKTAAILCIIIGLLSFLLYCNCLINNKNINGKIELLLCLIAGAVLLYLSVMIGLRWYISGYVPMSNGFETMQFMAWCSIALSLSLRKKFVMLLPFGFLLCGLTIMVAMMGEANPRITQLMPVLSSPLLSIHVAVIMVAYSLFAFMMLNGITAVIISITDKNKDEQIERLQIVSRLILYPAVFCLVIGIFVGAVWANISWGRYWGWDPKEVWALITMLVYSFAIHADSLTWFRRPMFYHIFSIIAFLSVLITYFGVNFILGGMHSYA